MRTSRKILPERQSPGKQAVDGFFIIVLIKNALSLQRVFQRPSVQGW
jgi:hypothetical protein